MSKLASALAITTLLVSGSSAFAWEDYDGGMNNLRAQGDALANKMAAMQRQITIGAINDPQVRAAYQQYRAQGGDQDLATWAYNYRATLGYDPRVMRDVAGQQNEITEREREAWAGVRRAEAGSAAAIGTMNGHFSDNMNGAGMTLEGQRLYTTPTGGQVQLSELPSAGTSYDGATGYTYVPNGDGSYTAISPNGYRYRMGY